MISGAQGGRGRVRSWKGDNMPRTSPWHADSADVYHNNTACTLGNNIERRNRREGTGGKRQCDPCKRLGKAGK